jgi:transcriptional regulator with XRE-family HTH domain
MSMIAIDREGLGAYLVSQRAKLRPEAVGLPPGGRRRTPGLRREEVAQLSGLGVTWYTWLEQGRDIQVSTPGLDRIAAALRLNPTERAHLFLLAGRSAPPMPLDPAAPVSPLIRRLIDGLHDQPALVRNGRWDAIAWNRGATLLFTDPWFRQFLPDWQNDARRCIARFRTNFARASSSPAYQQLVADLTAASPEFAAFWRQHDVLAPSDGLKRFDHPVVGMMELEHTVLPLSDTNDLCLIVYSAAPGTTSADRLARLLAMVSVEESD